MDRRPLIIAGLLLGIDLGGFADGILFHQILQIHNMLSAWISLACFAALVGRRENHSGKTLLRSENGSQKAMNDEESNNPGCCSISLPHRA